MDSWNKLSKLKSDPGWEVTNAAAVAELEKNMNRWEGRIEAILELHPDLEKVAAKNGWVVGPQGPETPVDADGDGKLDPPKSEGNEGGGSGGSGGGGGAGGGGGGSGGGGGGGSSDVDKGVILGKKGKDYELVRSGNGKFAVVYKVKLGNHVVKVAWNISKSEMEKAGLSASQAKPLTKKQWKSLKDFGNIDDIPDFQYNDKKNPFAKTIEYIEALYGGQGILKNKDVAAILAAGYIEGLPEQVILGQIRQTDWYQSRSDYQRTWLALAEGEKQGRINSTKVALKAKLESMFGDGWMDHATDEDIDKWATSIAAGQYGIQTDYNSAFAAWELKMLKKAEGQMGTPAQINADEADQALADSDANPAVMFEQIRNQATEWLGYFGKPDESLLQRWANDLSSGRRSQMEWESYLRQQKQSLYRNWGLEEKETWMDAVSPYKNGAEALLGTTLTFDDELFKDLSGKDAQGRATGFRMTFDDFENRVRQDDRYRTSSNANEMAAGFANFITGMFTGGSQGGGF